MIKWNKLGRDGGEFILVSQPIRYGNCTQCFNPLPIGMLCIHCSARHRGRSKESYFVNSEMALQCKSPEKPPVWFTKRYRPCNPFQLGNKLMNGTTEPYFDVLFYNDVYTRTTRYDEEATHLWRPVAMHDLVDKLFDYRTRPRSSHVRSESTIFVCILHLSIGQ